MNSKKLIISTLFSLAAAAVIILSFQPCVGLLYEEYLERTRDVPFSYYRWSYFDYVVIRSLLIAFAGIGAGSILLWIGGKIQSETARKPKSWRMLAFWGRRMAVLTALVAAAIITFHFRPELATIFDKQLRAEQYPQQVNSYHYLIMTNDTTPGPILFTSPNQDTNLWLNTSGAIALPKGYGTDFQP